MRRDYRQSALSAYLAKALTVLGIFAAVVILLTLVWTAASTRTYTYTYRLKAEGRNPTQKELAQTMDVLGRRLTEMRRRLGYSKGAVVAVEPAMVRIHLRARSDPALAADWLTLPGWAEFRLLHPEDDILTVEDPDTLPEGYEVRVHRYRTYILSKPGDLETREDAYVVQQEPVLSIRGFQNVEVNQIGLHRTAVLTFELEPADAERMARISALNAGRRMAMLIDGEMFFPPRQIDGPLTSGTLEVQGNFYMPPLRKLVQMLDAGSLPLRLTPVGPPTVGRERI